MFYTAFLIARIGAYHRQRGCEGVRHATAHFCRGGGSSTGGSGGLSGGRIGGTPGIGAGGGSAGGLGIWA